MYRDEPLPIGGSVDLFGKPFTLSKDKLRRTKNLISDGDGNLVRRGTLSFVGCYFFHGVAATELRVGDGSSTIIGDDKPVWFSIIPFGSGMHVGLIAAEDRADFFFGNIVSNNAGGQFWSINAVMAPLRMLPSVVTHSGRTYIFYGPNEHAPESGAFATGGAGIRAEFLPDGTFAVTDFTFDGITNAAAKPHLATMCRNRVWYGNFGPGGNLPNTVIIADIDEPMVIGTSALTDRNFVIGAGDDDELIAMHTVMLVAQGSPADTAVLCLKRRSAHLGLGEPSETDDVDYFGTLQINQISSNAGCVSAASICDTPYGTIWCGPDDVWFMPFGAVPFPIGKAIRPLLLAQPVSQSFRIHAVYADGFYRLALFSPGQGPNHSTPLGEQWWLDLRGWEDPEQRGYPRWYGPQVFNVGDTLSTTRNEDSTNVGTSCMAVDNKGKLYGLHYGIVNSGVATDPVVPPMPKGPVLVSYDTPDARDIGGLYRPTVVPWVASHEYQVGEEVVVYENVTDLHASIFVVLTVAGTQLSDTTEPAWSTAGGFGIADNEIIWFRMGTCLTPTSVYGSEADWELHSREYHMGSKLLEKLWLGADFALLIGAPTRIKLTQMIDSGKLLDESYKDLDNASGPDVGADILGTDPVAPFESLVPFTEEYQAVAIDSDENTRALGKINQIQLVEWPGLYLKSLTFEITIGFVVFAVTLPTDWYTDTAALAEAVKTAMNADAALVAALGSTMSVTTTRGLIRFSTVGNAWAPGIGTSATRYLWSLMGFTPITGSELTAHNGNEIAHGVSVGSTFGVSEGTIKYRINRRRPTP